jgi:GTP-binding protein
MSRTVAIVGRPNVGKSALFNRLAGRKIAIVHDQPGVTRDRIRAECRLGSAPFAIFDTGGIGADVDASFKEQVQTEADIAIATSDVLLLVVDGQDGLTAVDAMLARQLRKARKPIVIAVNKIDHAKHGSLAGEFEELGFECILSISAEHNHGIGQLVEELESRLPEFVDGPKEEPPLKITIIGRPNVGKSSLTNAILGSDRTMVSPISGTTRDAVDVEYTRKGKRYILIDTAGIRARGKVNNSVEVFSVMRSETSVKRADLCCLVIDAEMGVTSQDKKIASLIQEAGKPCVIAINKSDLIKNRTDGKDKLEQYIQTITSELFFLPYAPTVLLSAKTGEDIRRLFTMFDKVQEASRQRVATGPLNRIIEAAFAQQPAAIRKGKRFKVIYATMPEKPYSNAIPVPEFVFFVNNSALLDESYRRFLEAKIREVAPFTGLPIFFRFRGREKRGAK